MPRTPPDKTDFREPEQYPGIRVYATGAVWSRLRPTDWDEGGWYPLKFTPNADGYPTVKVGGRSRLVHTLVAEVFLGPCPPGMEVLHGDGVRTNCALSNLRYGTKQENRADQDRHGTAAVGERHPLATASDADIAEARRLAESGLSQRAIAAQLNTTQATVSRWLAGKTRRKP